MFFLGTEIGTENRGFSLVSVPNTEILVQQQHCFSAFLDCFLQEDIFSAALDFGLKNIS